MKPADVARLIALSALWGGSFLFIRVTAPVLGPVALIAARVLMGGLVLLLYGLLTGQELGFRRYWRAFLAIGVINTALPFVLIAFAELRLTASLAAIVNATTPLFGALVAYLWLREPLTRRKLAGIALGLAGVVIVVGWGELALTPANLIAVGASVLGALCYGIGGVLTKAKAAGAPAFGLAAGSQLSAALVTVPLAPLAWPAAVPSAGIIWAVIALGLACTALAYVLYFRLVVDVGPLKAMTVTFLVPIFGTLWGALFLDERLTASTILGCAVVLAGTALVTGFRLGAIGPTRTPVAAERPVK